MKYAFSVDMLPFQIREGITYLSFFWKFANFIQIRFQKEIFFSELCYYLELAASPRRDCGRSSAGFSIGHSGYEKIHFGQISGS